MQFINGDEAGVRLSRINHQVKNFQGGRSQQILPFRAENDRTGTFTVINAKSRFSDIALNEIAICNSVSAAF